MTEPTGIKGGMIRVLLGNGASPEVFSAPCGLTSRSVTINKNLQDFTLPDCENPDTISWVGRDAVSLSMGISGEGVLASESVEPWLDAVESEDSINVKVEWEFPAKTITWTGKMHVETFEGGGDNGVRATKNISMQSDGKMTRVVS